MNNPKTPCKRMWYDADGNLTDTPPWTREQGDKFEYESWRGFESEAAKNGMTPDDPRH